MREIRDCRRAYKQLERIPQPQLGRLLEAVKAMRVEWPQVRNVKSLVGRDGFRLRVGNRRFSFTVEADTITVQEVKKRDERTY